MHNPTISFINGNLLFISYDKTETLYILRKNVQSYSIRSNSCITVNQNIRIWKNRQGLSGDNEFGLKYSDDFDRIITWLEGI